MKKRYSALICIIAICVIALVPSFAISASAVNDLRLVDDADLLKDNEKEEIEERLDEISEKYEIDVVIVTVDSTDRKSPMDFADDYFDYNGYGYGSDRDGILLLISMEERDWWISTSGKAIDIFSDSFIESMGDSIVDYLADEYYSDAFNTFIDDCDYYINGELNGYPFNYVFTIIFSLIAGLIVALIATGIMKGKLKSVRFQNAAGNYIKKGSMVVSVSRDLYLYKTVRRVARPKSNSSSGSTHRSSSGRSHGGGGGKF